MSGRLAAHWRHGWARLRPEPLALSPVEARRAVGASLLAILLTSLSSHWLLGDTVPLLVASMGAASVLLYVLPASPLAQPWAFAGGHLVSAAIGVACARWIPWLPVAAACAVGLSIWAMIRLRCLHPPGGAIALAAVLGGEAVREAGFSFVWAPVGLNVVLMLLLALAINNMIPGRRYPRLPAESDNPHRIKDARPLERLGVQHEDIAAALANYGTLLDISGEDLDRVLSLAEMHTYRRKLGDIRCGDIMSRDLVTIAPAASLAEAWQLLRRHKIKALPVEADGRLVGIITLVDILRSASADTPADLRQWSRRLLSGRGQPQTVADLMTRDVRAVTEASHIVELVPLLSDLGHHHLPVIDGQGRPVGIVTQSDLIAALYRGSLG